MQEFVKAVIAYQKKLNIATAVPKPLNLNKEMENKRRTIVRSFSLARNIYITGNGMNPSKESELQAGAEFLEVSHKILDSNFLIICLHYVLHNLLSDLWYVIYCLQSNTALSLQQENRLKQMGATIRNGSSYLERLKLNEERERLARNVIGKMSVEQLSDLMSFYFTMGQICSEVLEKKLHGIVNNDSLWQGRYGQNCCELRNGFVN